MTTNLDRRTFLRSSVTLALATGAQFFTGIPALADYAAGPTLRRNAFGMNATDPILRGYRRGIRAMRALPDENPCSWFYQAAIHGTDDPRGLTAWNSCHTDPTFFWAWHRMYLYWFERIVRKYSDMYDWAIPYWDWTDPSERAMPAEFRRVGGTLYDATRNASVNGGAELSTSLATSVTSAMALLNYFNTQSSVNGPHGSVHIAVNGNMSTFETAAQDPIFWVHHSQVDRLWNLWLAQGAGRSNPVGDATWRNTTYTFFDECCNEVSMKGCDVLRAARQLSYSYEDEPTQVNQYCPRVWDWLPDISAVITVASWPGPFEVRNGPIRFKLEKGAIEGAAGRSLDEVIRNRKQPAILQIKGIEADVQPGVSWEVYVGPQGLQPDPKSRHFVGIFALFSGGIKTRKHHYSPTDFVFRADEALRTVNKGQEIEVVLIPTTGLDTDGKSEQQLELRAPLTIREFSIGIDAAMALPPQDVQDKLRRQEDIE
jgi:hypothetical protein